MTAYDELRIQLVLEPKRWLITGVAGFIGSGLLEELLFLNQTVVGLDNFSLSVKNNGPGLPLFMGISGRLPIVRLFVRMSITFYIRPLWEAYHVPCRILSRQIALTLMVF